MRGPSASEWAGFADSTSIARYRSGWSVRISSAMTLHGTSPEMITRRRPESRRRAAAPSHRCRSERHDARGTYWPPGLREVAGQQPQQLLEIAAQGRVQVHLHAEVFEHRHARRPAMRRAVRRTRLGIEIAHRGVCVDVDPGQDRLDLFEADGVRRRAILGRGGPPARCTAASAARHHASVPGRRAKWIVGELGGFGRRGSSTTIDRFGSRAISFSVVRA